MLYTTTFWKQFQRMQMIKCARIQTTTSIQIHHPLWVVYKIGIPSLVACQQCKHGQMVVRRSRLLVEKVAGHVFALGDVLLLRVPDVEGPARGLMALVR